ncbi:MAG: hypothetical protein ACJAYU_000827 [Bradymonadia bacterium]|jgi:hypothetical protein
MSEENNGDPTEAETKQAEKAAKSTMEDAAPAADTAATKEPAAKATETEPAEAKPAPKAKPAADDVISTGTIHTNGQAIDIVFTGTGSESEPGDPHKSKFWDDDLDGPIKNQTSPRIFVGTIIGLIVLIGAGYALLPGDLKTDAVDLLQGTDIIEARELREQARVEAERAAMLAAAPKFGTVEIVSAPNNLLITSEGHPSQIFPGTRTDLTYPTRTRVTYKDISVTDDFVFTIHGEGNYADLEYTIPAFGQPDSPWAQSFTGDYNSSLTFMVCWPGEPARVEEEFCLRPAADTDWRARELQWRNNWRPDPEATEEDAIIRLPGTITVTSEPVGAMLAFNGRQLVNEENLEAPVPLVTPVSFANYNAPADHEDRTPFDVYLSREGLPLQLLYDGKASMTMGIYLHQFNCTIAEGQTVPEPVAADAPEGTVENWLGVCDYTYSLHAVLSDPKPPEEGSGEGSGSGDAAPAEAAAPAAAGSGAAAPAEGSGAAAE